MIAKSTLPPYLQSLIEKPKLIAKSMLQKTLLPPPQAPSVQCKVTLIVSVPPSQPKEDKHVTMAVEEEPEVGGMINLFLINF
jgi:hypothetical protein